MGKIGEDKDAESVKMEKKKKSKKNRTNNLLDVDDGKCHVEIDGGLPKEKKRKSESNEKHNLEEDNGKLRKKDKKKRKRDFLENNRSSEKANDQGWNDVPVAERDCDPQPIRKEKKRKHKHHSLEKELENDSERGEKKKKKISDGKKVEISSNECEEDMLQKNDKKEKKKKKTVAQNSDAKMNEITTDESVKEDKKKNKSVEKAKAKGKPKRVSFSGHVEVFPSFEEPKSQEDGLIRGKRFTPEEDAIVKQAVLNYIEAHGLGEEGLSMVLTCMSHPGMKKCWQEIGTCIPYRPHTAVYSRAHILFERAERRSWSPEEIQFLHDFHKKHGNNWKMAAAALGKNRIHVKDTWRRIKVKNNVGGRWSQEEYQNLYDLVNLDLQMKVTHQQKRSKHGMLRDDIPWGAISEKLSTRSDATCCFKWYNQLTSSLVAEKKWSDADDYRLIGALYELDAPCAEDVDWDSLLAHRQGEICRKRWDQMVKHIGYKGSMPFAEQVDILAKRYCPDLAETREAWDNLPIAAP